MSFTWLHVSDFHFRSGDPYDRDVVLKALVQSVRYFREQGREPGVIFATGDVATFGKASEYETATTFFDDLLNATGLDRRRLFVVPGNHDVDRDLGVGLIRTLDSREQADAYFNPAVPKSHITLKQGAFVAWYDHYFDGIRTFPQNSTCGPIEVINVGGDVVGVLSINSALFCQDNNDHDKLWVGRRCLSDALDNLGARDPHLTIALLHHPLHWLSNLESANIKAALQENIDVVLRGHLHETDVESVAGLTGTAVHIAAGAAYQTRKWPNRVLYVTFDGAGVTIFPIRYEDQPQEVWTVDPSVFPYDPNYEKRFPIGRLVLGQAHPTPAPAKAQSPVPQLSFRSKIPSGRNRPSSGREGLLINGQPEERFDVFLSHSHTDAEAVELIGVKLEDEAGFRVWLDRWILVPGHNWQQGISRGLNQANTCVVCVGNNTPSGWFQEEIERALNRQTKDRWFRVIPVILPGGNMGLVGDFLELRTWVDLSNGIDNADAFHVLICGIRGVPPGRRLKKTTNPSDDGSILRTKLSKIRDLRLEMLIDKEIALEYQRRILDGGL